MAPSIRALVVVWLVTLALGHPCAAPAVTGPLPAPEAPRAASLESYGRLPLRFEQNRGQWDDRARFVARTSGGTLFLTPGEAVLAVRGAEGCEPETLRIALEGAEANARLIGEGELAGRSNYFTGDDPRRWRTNVPGYARVRCKEVLPGVDVVYYGNQRELEFDLVVAAGVDPSALVMRYEGARKLRVDEEGGLVAELDAGKVRQRPPVCYQVGERGREAVAGRYVLEGERRVGFAIGDYDRSRPLVVDPVVLGYSTFLGGALGDSGEAIAVDPTGVAYVAGNTLSVDFPSASGYDATHNGFYDVFVTKLSAAGDALVYSTYLGGNRSDYARAIEVDGSGAAYVTGDTRSTDFPTASAFDTEMGGFSDVFVTKLGPDGSQLLYSTFVGGSDADYGNGLAVDAAGATYLTGETRSSDFPTLGAFDTTVDGTRDAFVTKLSPAGNQLGYSTLLGGGDADVGYAVAVDGAGAAYVAGYTYSPDFPTASAFDDTFNAGSEAFVTKLAAAGTHVVFSTFLGGNDHDRAYAIAVDGASAVFVAGSTQSQDFPTASAFDATYNFFGDAFVAKLTAGGNQLAYSTFLGGTKSDVVDDIAIDATGAAYVTGSTSSTNFPVVAAYDATYNGDLDDAFAAKVDASGNWLVYSTYLGGIATDVGNAIAVDAAGAAYVVGNSFSSDFPTTGAFDATHNGDGDAFVTKLHSARIDTPGVYAASSGAWFLRNANSPGPADLVYGYGPVGLGWVPISGDWDGDGIDTPGLYDPATGTFFLKNSNGAGPADLVYGFGPPGSGWATIVGDWNGDGVDTIGLYDPASGNFFLRNAHAAGPADLVFGYGAGGPDWQPLSGDWNGDGTDTVGLFASSTSTFFLRNADGPGPADVVTGFGPAGSGWVPLTGDWDGDGADAIGLYDPASGYYFLKNATTPGPADLLFGYGPAGATPLAGEWDGV